MPVLPFFRQRATSWFMLLCLSSSHSLAQSYLFSTLAGQPPQTGSADGPGADARFWFPSNTAVDTAGNVYVADTFNHTIRRITSTGVTTTFAGAPGQIGSADGTASNARFNSPTGVAGDRAGNLYVADGDNHVIR